MSRMMLEFTKMHGQGNDFVVVDAVRQGVAVTPAQVRHLADRHRGVGCDQVLVIGPPEHGAGDFFCHIYNADGSEAEQCGNGMRCCARFVRDAGLTDKAIVVFETLAGPTRVAVVEEGYEVDMGIPQLAPASVPIELGPEAPRYGLELDDGEVVTVGAVSMGNPHVVLRVGQVADAPVAALGPRLERHPRLPAGANVGFMEVVTRGHIRLRVYERGAGETLACGSAACAAVVVGIVQGLLDNTVTVTLPGGSLMVCWPAPGRSVYLTGPATSVFTGRIDL